jgi:hypothetical protein
MRKTITPTLFALLLAAGPALAQFEGVLEMKMTMTTRDGESSGGGTMNVSVSKAGTRSEMNMKMGAMDMKMVMLRKAETPDITYRIDDANKSYTEMDLAKMRAMASRQQESPKYTVEKLGQETILGYKTQHVQVKDTTAGADRGLTLEMWTAKDLLDYETFSKMQVRRGKAGSEEALVKALKDAGADGLPLKSVSSTPDGGKATMEVLKVEKKSLPASTFEIPAGYAKSEGGLPGMMGGVGGPQSDAAKQRMEEAMKNMTPEQRQMIENMMKKRQGGNP